MGKAANLAAIGSIADTPLQWRNRIINGDMRIDQRNAGASVSINDGNEKYPVDRWFGIGTASAGVFSLQRSTATPPAGFSNFLRAAVTTVDSSLAATDFYGFAQRIEGFNTSDLALGSASASAMTLSFWVRSSLTGTFSGSLNGNPASSASFPFTFTINAANTWEYKTVSVAAPTSGTFPTDNTIGLTVWFTLALGSNFTGTAGAWTAAARFGASGAVNVMATNGATLDITGVQLEAGSIQAPVLERRPYGHELAMCQRYYQRHAILTSTSFTTAYPTSLVRPDMRAEPTLTATFSGGTGGAYQIFSPAGAVVIYQSVTHSSVGSGATINATAEL
jgi:hypothetical protein